MGLPPSFAFLPQSQYHDRHFGIPALGRRTVTAIMAQKPAHVRIMKKALDYLGRYASSRYKLAQVLQRFAARKLADYDPRDIGAAIQHTLDQCTQFGYIDDRQFAVAKVRSQRRLGRSEAAIRQKLRQHALDDAIIGQALAEVDEDSEVITQPLTFVATCNAISYCNAKPIFVDVDKDTMSLSPAALQFFLEKNTIFKNNKCINKKTKKIIKACVPMHSYGHPCRIDEIKKILKRYNIFLIEDAAESLGSFYKNKHTGTFGELGVISFNGNKIVTAGGGGCIITNNKTLAKKAKYLSTTAKIPHKWDFNHDMVGYNYRMPNLNAAFLVAQLEKLNDFIINKRNLANKYETFFKDTVYNFFKEPKNSRSNYWLNTIILENKKIRDQFLEKTNSNGIMTRPTWKLMNKLPMYKNSQCSDLKNSNWLFKRVINIPSSVTL